MLKSFLTTDTDVLPDETNIDWLDTAIVLACIIVAHIIQEIENPKNRVQMEDWQSLVMRQL